MAAISTFALAATAVAGLASAVGSIVQGSQQASLAKYNQKLAQQNAVIAGQQAAEDAARSRTDTRRRIAAIEAAYGANGIDLSGTALDVIDDATVQGELDAKTIEYKGLLEQRRYLSGANEQGFRASSAELAGYAGAAGALLSTAGRIGGSFSGSSSSSASTGVGAKSVYDNPYKSPTIR